LIKSACRADFQPIEPSKPTEIEQSDTTTLIEPGPQGSVAENGTLILTTE